MVPEAYERLLGEILGLGPVIGPGQREPEHVGPVRLEGAFVGELGGFRHRRSGGHTYIHDADGQNARSRRP